VNSALLVTRFPSDRVAQLAAVTVTFDHLLTEPRRLISNGLSYEPVSALVHFSGVTKVLRGLEPSLIDEIFPSSQLLV